MKKFTLFNLAKDGKGVKKEPVGPKNFKNFFKLYFRKFGSLVTVNMLFIFGNFPFIFGLLAMSGNLNKLSSTPASTLFAPLHGAMLHSSSPVTAALFGTHGLQVELPVYTTATYVMFALSALIIFTFGLTCVGTTYILRNMVKGEPIFMWADFWYAIKRNLKQGIIVGILDVVFMVLICYDIIFFYFNIGAFFFNVMFYISLFVAILYLLMRFYMYIILITFDLSIFKIFKNSLIFALLGFKRNIMAVLGIVFLIFVNYSVLLMFIPLGVVIPFILLFSNGAFMSTYAAFPKIKEIMIDPYTDESENNVSDIEPIFKDMG